VHRLAARLPPAALYHTTDVCPLLLQCLAKVTHSVITMQQYDYSHAPHNDVSVDRQHVRQWSHNIIIVTAVLQLPTVFSAVTCCTGL
jgi:hypothetical protein